MNYEKNGTKDDCDCSCNGDCTGYGICDADGYACGVVFFRGRGACADIRRQSGRLQEQHADTWHDRTGETVGADQDQVQQSDRV